MHKDFCSYHKKMICHEKWKVYVFPAGWACERGVKQSSLTLNGEPGYEPGCPFHALSHESVFLLLLDSATVFPPSHPSESYCLLAEFFWKCINILGSFFTFCRLQFCYHCDFDRSVNKVLLHCRMADKMHSVCEKNNYFWLLWGSYF